MTLSHKAFADYIMTLPGVWLDYPFGEESAVYKYGVQPEGKIVAIVAEGVSPLRVSLKCDPKLALLLREKYETVLPGYHLNKKHWNTIICTGQLSNDEIFDLARLSYNLVSGSNILKAD
jgi:predicted DNA-binding protein (MmcQ/YjbR family)